MSASYEIYNLYVKFGVCVFQVLLVHRWKMKYSVYNLHAFLQVTRFHHVYH